MKIRFVRSETTIRACGSIQRLVPVNPRWPKLSGPSL
jgi:hypothetical protein